MPQAPSPHTTNPQLPPMPSSPHISHPNLPPMEFQQRHRVIQITPEIMVQEYKFFGDNVEDITTMERPYVPQAPTAVISRTGTPNVTLLITSTIVTKSTDSSLFARLPSNFIIISGSPSN